MEDQKISRRDMLLIGSGLAVLCVGKLADSALNGVGLADQQALATASARLTNLPAEIGNWTSTDAELSEREIDAAGIHGYVRREYRNDRTGYSVFLTVLCGNAGPMSVHPPTACFQGVGYKLISGPAVTPIKSEGSSYIYEFNKSSFRQGDVSVPEIVRVFWGWAPDGNWKAPSNPRFAFRGHSYLYKIYVTDSSLEEPGQTSLPQIESFLQDVLPVISEALAG
ncbi:MAG: exosortase-associated EpsI family protein [Planctomycetaceae bacterium]